VEDQPADPGDLTTDADEADETPVATDEAVPQEATEADGPEALPRRRRWGFIRRPSKTPDATPDSTAEALEPEEPEPAVRTPVGKAGRTARTAAAPASTEEPAEDAAEAAETADASEEGAETAEDAPILVPHRPAGKRLTIAAVAAGVLFVAAGAFAGATLQPYLADRALVDTKLDIATTAANAITTLWTYTPDNMDSLPDRSAVYLGGDFANEYRKYIDAIVAPNKQAQVTNTTQVMGAAVETVTPAEATAIVYTNSVATSPVTKNIPSLRYLSYRLTMQRHDAKWLITRMSTVTSFDLTPQL
jgi:Mce-associated membrane protein